MQEESNPLVHFVYWGNRHMFEVEQIEYEKEEIDWSYITFNDNKVHVVHIGLVLPNMSWL